MRTRNALVSVAVALALFGASLSLRTLIQPTWMPQFWTILGLVALLLAGSRLATPDRLQRNNPIPPLVALAGGTWFILTSFGSQNLTYARIPAPGTITRIGQLIPLAQVEFRTGAAPLQPTYPVLFTVFAVGILLLILADILAHSRVPLLAAIPVLSLWTPAIGLGWAVGRVSFLETTVGLLLLLFALNLRGESTKSRNGAAKSLATFMQLRWRAAVAATVALAAGLGSAIIANNMTAEHLEASRLLPVYNTGGAGIGFGPTLATNQVLGDRSDEVLFSYTTSNHAEVGPLRFATYSDFDGQTWFTLPAIDGISKNRETVADGGNISLTPDSQRTIDVSFTTVGLTGNLLPLTGNPRAISVEGLWHQDIANDIATARTRLRPGTQFEVSLLPRLLHPAVLRAAKPGVPFSPPAADLAITGAIRSSGASESSDSYPFDEVTTFWLEAAQDAWADPIVDPTPASDLVGWVKNSAGDIAFLNPRTNADGITTVEIVSLRDRQLALPPDAAIYIEETARQIVGDAPTFFDGAVLLQNYLRNVNEFTYTTTPPPPVTGNMVIDFLEARNGYCVHFATAMVMLSRAMGIPARLAVGYLPGTRLNDEKWVVTGMHSHSWAELYFGPDIGWVNFDPTPAAVSGTPPAHTMGLVPNEEMLFDHSEYDAMEYLGWGSSSFDPEAFARDVAAAEAGRHLASTSDTIHNLILWGSGALALAAIAGGFLGVRAYRRRKLVSEEAVLTRATAILGRRGIEILPGTTPRQLSGVVTSGWEQKYNSPPPVNLLLALRTITGAVEETRYCGAENSLSTADLRAALKEVTKAKPVKSERPKTKDNYAPVA